MENFQKIVDDENHADRNETKTVLDEDGFATYPLIALKGSPMFPDTVIAIDVGRKISMNAIEEAQKSDLKVVFAIQKDSKIEMVTPKDIKKFGVLAKIKQFIKSEEFGYKIIVQNLERVSIRKIDLVNDGTMLSAKVKVHKNDEIKINSVYDAFMRSITNVLKMYSELITVKEPNILQMIEGIVDPCKYIDIVCTYVLFDINIKQKLLEELNLEKRFELLHEVLVKEVEILKYEISLNEKFRKEISESQREYFLRQQIKILNRELGNDDENGNFSDSEKFIARLEELKLDEDIDKKIRKEIDRFDKLSPMGSEYENTEAYLNRVLDLPWNERSESDINLSLCKEILDRDHFGLDEVKDRILEYLAVKQMTSDTKSSIICLVGPPGVGKTSIAKSIAESIGRKFVRLSLGGVRDEAQIRGHRRTYVGAIPGKIMSVIEDAGTKNPVILMDEIDKLGNDYRGDPTSALLEVLDKEQNKTFVDHYFDLPFDLSEVMFITTANTLDSLSRPLLDRMEVIELSGYTSNEKFNIAKKYLLPKQLKEHALKNSDVGITSGALKSIIENYTRESGVRSLDRKIEKICRKVSKKIVSQKEIDANHKHEKISIKKSDLKEYLGNDKILDNHISKVDQVGIVTGLAWTSVGGDTLQIEAVTFAGSSKLELTGQMGDVMQESAKTGISYIRSKCSDFSIDSNFYKTLDIHIHIPEGAVPKDGPSAGITMCLSVLSAITGRKVRCDVAMTGEMTLRGNVLAIGGLKEKCLAALRDGIKIIIIPYDNIKDIEEIPEDLREQLTFKPVKHFDEVVEIALRK